MVDYMAGLCDDDEDPDFDIDTDTVPPLLASIRSRQAGAWDDGDW